MHLRDRLFDLLLPQLRVEPGVPRVLEIAGLVPLSWLG
jgi:hypothetical protein